MGFFLFLTGLPALYLEILEFPSAFTAAGSNIALLLDENREEWVLELELELEFVSNDLSLRVLELELLALELECCSNEAGRLEFSSNDLLELSTFRAVFLSFSPTLELFLSNNLE
ncbi:hypothetical protein [Paraflavitalea sp. CAU 1676]|uniref:hypothetical protein n=1 Tax=Paraflavitalea sp. CAU 1676 TaxID=3032598 RepID=UPI0023D9880D|nr:hypothetical protein [Paraflavitalea sp. CAU 1676]